MCILSVCTLLKVECSVHASDGFPKKSLDRGVGGWDERYPVLFWIFLTLQSP